MRQEGDQRMRNGEPHGPEVERRAKPAARGEGTGRASHVLGAVLVLEL